MTRRLFLGHVLALSAGGLALAGCATRRDNLKPNAAVRLVVDPAKKSTTASLRERNLLELTLPPPPAGHEWQVSYHDMRYTKQMTPIQPPAQPGQGATVSFLALHYGRTSLAFVLLPITDSRIADVVGQHVVVLSIR